MTDTNTTTPLTAANRPVSLTVRDIDRELSQGVPIPGRNGEPPLREDDRTKHELLAEIDRLAARVAQLEAPAAGLSAERIREIEAEIEKTAAMPYPTQFSGVTYLVHVRSLLDANRAQAAEIEELKAARNRAHLEGRRAILDETDALRQRAEDAELIAWMLRRQFMRDEQVHILTDPKTGAKETIFIYKNGQCRLTDAARAALKAAKEGRR